MACRAIRNTVISKVVYTELLMCDLYIYIANTKDLESTILDF